MNKLLQENREFSEGLLRFLNESPTACHAVENGVKLLEQNGFRELKETQVWALEPGGKYYLVKNRSSLAAFVIGNDDPAGRGFRILGAHTDSPSLKIKPGACTVTADGYVKVNVEIYGGAILSSWFDRPLALAGRVVAREEDGLAERLVKIHRPLLMLPNLCIHFHREVNDNCSYNRQTEIVPFLCMKRDGVEKEDYLPALLAQEMQVAKEDILDYELYLYEYQSGIFTGVEEEFLSASRIDDLAMVYGGLNALISSESEENKIFVAFDNEEVGSASAQGAASGFFLNLLERICKNLGLDDEGYYRAIAHSTSVSADNAHAVHPNYSDKHDPENRPVLGGGPVIKYSASQRYGTTALTAAMFLEACRRAGVPCQRFVNRNDITGGSTIGPALSSRTTIPTVDMGTAILAMHSIREFGAVIDNIYTLKAFRSYYDM